MTAKSPISETSFTRLRGRATRSAASGRNGHRGAWLPAGGHPAFFLSLVPAGATTNTEDTHAMLTPTEAADIARRAGLTLADAVALRMLADDTEEATELAGRFATSGNDGAFAAALFGHPDRAVAPPIEGPDPDADDRRFVAQLFARPDKDTR